MIIPAASARRLFLGAQGLLDDPARRATPASVLRLVHRLGFVQLDSINVIARAHDLTLHTRLDGYRPKHLDALLWKDRHLFEHWTHDAAIIPTAWYEHWKPRFRLDRERIAKQAWWQSRVGSDADELLARVRRRIEEQGALKSSDFEHHAPREPWWGWKPAKAALDVLWRTGELAIAGRQGFQKLYDLTERVLPEPCARPEPDDATHLQWACESAAERLVVFTPRELAGFWAAIDLAAARVWCANAVSCGRLVAVTVASADGSAPQSAFALAPWRERLGGLPEAPERIRLLSPFDPILRDRARGKRRFGFDYRFEAFVPGPQRQYGYYALPILDGERLVGRLDPKLHRDQGRLEVRGLWWEPGIKPNKRRMRALGLALERLAAFVGATELTGPGASG